MRLTKDVEVTGHFANVIGAAQKANATTISIQSYWTFCNFTTREHAEQFRFEMLELEYDVSEINTYRPLVPFEVMVHHPR